MEGKGRNTEGERREREEDGRTKGMRGGKGMRGEDEGKGGTEKEGEVKGRSGRTNGREGTRGREGRRERKEMGRCHGFCLPKLGSYVTVCCLPVLANKNVIILRCRSVLKMLQFRLVPPPKM